MGKGNTSSVCTCPLHVYIDTSLASRYIKKKQIFRKKTSGPGCHWQMKKGNHFTLRFFFYLKTLKCFSLVLVTEKGEHSDSQQPETTTWNSNTDSINTTCSCFLSCTSSSLASLSASSWRRLSYKNNIKIGSLVNFQLELLLRSTSGERNY